MISAPASPKGNIVGASASVTMVVMSSLGKMRWRARWPIFSFAHTRMVSLADLNHRTGHAGFIGVIHAEAEILVQTANAGKGQIGGQILKRGLRFASNSACAPFAQSPADKIGRDILFKRDRSNDGCRRDDKQIFKRLKMLCQSDKRCAPTQNNCRALADQRQSGLGEQVMCALWLSPALYIGSSR